MGTIGLSAGVVIFLIIASSVIAIFPESINFFGTTIYLDAIHKLKSSMFYVYAVIFYFLIFAGLIVLFYRIIQFVRKNRIIVTFANWMLSFDEKHWKAFMKDFRAIK